MDFHKEIEQIHIYRKSFSAKPNRPSKKQTSRNSIFISQKAHHLNLLILGGKKVEIFTADNWSVSKSEGSEDGRKEIWDYWYNS